MARFGLPDINFVDVDAETWENAAVSKFEQLQSITLSESDPRRKFIQAMIFVLTMMSHNIDFAAKQNLLAYAVDDYLDNLDPNVPRGEATPAKTTMRFEVANPVDFTIPKGTRFKINEILFQTDADVIVTAGSQTVDVSATCEENGTIGNGYLPGQITELVDSDTPWISSVYNITKSDGGTDWEDDDSYAERIRLSKAQYSTAGPEDAYKYWAKTANTLISDVQVITPSASTVKIIILLENGELASQEIISQVNNALNDKTIRPLTDYVIVDNPEIVQYDIDLTYYISFDNSSIVSIIQGAVSQAVSDFQVWQKSKLGRDVDFSELIYRVKQAGAVKVTINSPSSFITINKDQVAISNQVNINYGGITDD